MKRETISTNFLRLFVVGIGLLVMVLCVFVIPLAAKEVLQYYPDYVIYPILVCLYGSAIPFYVALKEAWMLLGAVDQKLAFSDICVKALRSITLCAVWITALHGIILLFLYMIAQEGDAPGLILMGMVVPGAASVIAVFAVLLKKLLQEALEIKQDNDLTI